MAEGTDPLFVNWRTGEPMAFLDILDDLTFAELNTFFYDKGFRYRLNSTNTPFNLYVATTGSDSNDGRTPETAFLTWKRAVEEVVGNIDVGNFIPTINVADGTYEVDDDNAVVIETTAPFFQIIGNTSNPANVWLKYTGTDGDAIAMYGGEVLLSGMKITATLGCAIKHDQGYMVLSDFQDTVPTVIIGQCDSRQIRVKKNAFMDIGGLFIEGGATYGLVADRGGIIRVLGSLSRSGTPTYDFFACAAGGGAILMYGRVSGTVDGGSFELQAGGLIKTYAPEGDPNFDWIGDLNDLFGGTTGVLLPGGMIDGTTLQLPLTSGSVSNQATLSIDLTTCSQFRGLKIVLQGVRPATDGATLLLRTSSNGGASYDSGSTDYQWAAINVFAVDSSTADADEGSSIPLSGGVGNGASEGCDVEIIIYNQASETFTTRVSFSTAYVFTSGDISSFVGQGMRNSAANVDAIRFLFSAGNINVDHYAIYPLP